MKLIGLNAFALALILISAQSASACWCRREALDTEDKFRAAVATEVRNSAAVFVGEVIEQRRSRIQLKVEQVWKGKLSVTATLITGDWRDGDFGSIDSCAYPFKVGSKYLIFADKFENELKASKCSRTILLEQAGRDIEELKRIKPNSSPTESTRPDSVGSNRNIGNSLTRRENYLTCPTKITSFGVQHGLAPGIEMDLFIAVG